MASSAPASTIRRSPRWRFTIAGIFLTTFGISVGLAHWRLSQATVASAMLIACGAWLVLALTARAWRASDRLRPAGEPLPIDLARKAQWEFASSLGLIGMLLIAAVFDVAARFRWPALEGNHPDSWVATMLLNESLLYLAIICIFWTPWQRSSKASSATFRAWRRILDGLAMVAGICCLMVLVLDQAWIQAMVYVTIRGVENAQPWRWIGHEIQPISLATDALLKDFTKGGIFAVGLFSVGALFGAAWIRSRNLRPALSIVCLLLSAVCLIGTVGMLVWCRNGLLPRMSPIVPAVVGDQPLGNLILAGTLLFAASLAGATWLTAKTPIADLPTAASDRLSTGLIRQNPVLVGACLMAVITAIASDAWNIIRNDSSLAGVMPQLDWLYSPQVHMAILYHLGDWLQIYSPVRLLRIAALIVLAARAWQLWWGRPPQVAPPLNQLERREFAAAWLVVLILLLLAGPVGAWWAMAFGFRWYMGF